MHNGSCSLCHDFRDGCFESSGGRQEVSILRKVAYHIDHADLPNATALIAGEGVIIVVVAIPDAEEVLFRGFEGL